MMQPALILIKPDAISKCLVGHILIKFSMLKLEIVGMKITNATRSLAEKHYDHIRNESYFEDVIRYLMGEYHNQKKLLALIYYGEDAITKCRGMAGATNPEDADPSSIRGSFGRITAAGTYENVVHVSSDPKEAEREIKIWFKPDDLTVDLYPIKNNFIKIHKERVWI